MKLDNRGSAEAGGIGFFGMLGLIFIVLKLVGVINWSWVWVLAPFLDNSGCCDRAHSYMVPD